MCPVCVSPVPAPPGVFFVPDPPGVFLPVPSRYFTWAAVVEPLVKMEAVAVEPLVERRAAAFALLGEARAEC